MMSTRFQTFHLSALLSVALMLVACNPQGTEQAQTQDPAPKIEQDDSLGQAAQETKLPQPKITKADPARFAAAKAAEKPNILVIWGDDIGRDNISAYSHGIMGYRTPNIDRIAKEGAMFTDYYAEQSCTAGRSSFITGQLPFRTGLSKVGMPGAKQGLSEKDPTIAELLKNHGYTSGQFGKNHLGDRNEFLPTVHGFDEYSGVLYHLNALEEPENVDYPKDPNFFAKFGPRDVLYSAATEVNDATEHPRWGMVGKQKIKARGQLTKKRMETFDEETLKDSLAFMENSTKGNKPFFLWHNSTRMHVHTHLQPKYRAMVKEKGLAGAGMTEFDDHIGILLAKLEELGIAENTLVIVSTDNGAEKFSWPDGGTTPFRGEKATTWEGGFRVPAVVRWPGVIEPGRVINDIFHHMDWLPTILSALGEPDAKEKLKKGHTAAGKKFKVHLDGYDQRALLAGTGAGTRKEIHYITDDGDYSALRYNKWKVMFTSQGANGLEVWNRKFDGNRFPLLTDLRQDPYEQASVRGASYQYDLWHFDHAFVLVPAMAYMAKFLKTFDEFPPRAKAASFSIGDALSSIAAAPQN